MSLLFCDGFDHYSAAQMQYKYNSINSTPTLTTGRFGTGQCVYGNSQVISIKKSIPSNDTFIIGFAFKTQGSTTIYPILALMDTTDYQVELRMGLSNHLYVTRNGTIITGGGTASKAIKLNTWHYIEFKVTIANSIPASSCIVKLDGETVITVDTGQDLQYTSNASANAFLFTLASGTSLDNYFDDLYVCDDAGSVNNDFLGDVKIETLYPSGNGNSSQFVGSDADSTDNYALVDETLASTTDYVESSTSGNKDTYAFGDFSASPVAIKAVQTTAFAKKTDASARSYCDVCRSNSTDYDGTTQALASSDIFYTQVREVDPNTSTAWTESGLESAEFGIKVAA